MTKPKVLAELDDTIAWLSFVKDGVVAVDVSQDSRDKLKWLAEGGRDFFAPSPNLRGALVRSLADARKRRLSPAETSRAVGKAVKAVILERFTTNGGDVPMRPLSRAWLLRKASLGAPRLIGLFTQFLFGELKARTFRYRPR